MKDKVFQIRIDTETKNMLRQLRERFDVSGMSELVRLMIWIVYQNPDWFEYLIEKES